LPPRLPRGPIWTSESAVMALFAEKPCNVSSPLESVCPPERIEFRS
jgi:hypothetical protein